MNEKVPSPGSEMSLKEFILSVKEWLCEMQRCWIPILAAVTIGIGLGVLRYTLSKPVYKAESFFVLDEGKRNAGGLKLEMLGLGGGSDDGLFQTDNIIWLYSSRLMIERTLLSEIDTNGKKVILINWFLKESGLDNEIRKDKRLKNIVFSVKSIREPLSREQNAVVSKCVALINKQYLKVSETKGTDNIINVSFSAKDELLAKLFTDKIVTIVNSFYIQTKVGKIVKEVALLQQKADSIRDRLNRSMFQTASALDATPNLNPSLQVLRVKPQEKGVDVQVTSAIYTEVVKILETRKIDLAKETPLVQVIDAPILPLPSVRTGIVKSSILGGLAMGFLVITWLTLSRYYKKIINK